MLDLSINFQNNLATFVKFYALVQADRKAKTKNSSLYFTSLHMPRGKVKKTKKKTNKNSPKTPHKKKPQERL